MRPAGSALRPPGRRQDARRQGPRLRGLLPAHYHRGPAASDGDHQRAGRRNRSSQQQRCASRSRSAPAETRRSRIWGRRSVLLRRRGAAARWPTERQPGGQGAASRVQGESEPSACPLVYDTLAVGNSWISSSLPRTQQALDSRCGPSALVLDNLEALQDAQLGDDFGRADAACRLRAAVLAGLGAASSLARSAGQSSTHHPLVVVGVAGSRALSIDNEISGSFKTEKVTLRPPQLGAKAATCFPLVCLRRNYLSYVPPPHLVDLCASPGCGNA